MASNKSIERRLWIAFAVLFGLVVVATYLPTRPIVAVFPAWSLLVLFAAVGTLAVAVTAVFGAGWPAGGERG